MMLRSGLYKPVAVCSSRTNSVRPMSKLSGSNRCHVTGATVLGRCTPRGSATSMLAGISSVSPWRASAVVQQRVACGARCAVSSRSMSAAMALSVRPDKPRATGIRSDHSLIRCWRTASGIWDPRRRRPARRTARDATRSDLPVDEALGEAGGVQFADDGVDGGLVGEVDAAGGQFGGDLFGRSPGRLVVDGREVFGEMLVDGGDDRCDPLGIDLAAVQGEAKPAA